MKKSKLYGFLAVALVALAMPVSYGLAGGGQTATANIERHNDDCGDYQNGKFIGTFTYTRSGNTLTVTAKGKGADPGNYRMYLYDAGTVGCDYVGDLGKFKTDGGKFSNTGVANVAGTSGLFVACLYNYASSDPWSCATPAVQVGPNQLI